MNQDRSRISIKQFRRCSHQPDNGTRCKANAQTGSEFCFFHDPALAEKRAAARKAGGIARSRRVTLDADFPVKPLRTVAEVIELLGETINQVRRGEIDSRVSNAIGYLSGILLGAIEKGSFEGRLAALEAALANPSASRTLAFNEDDCFAFVHPNTGDLSSPDDQTKPTNSNRIVSHA